MAWIDVAAAEDVAPGAVHPVALDGVDVVVWRTREGRLAACDARCPHQWSYLGAEGFVDGEELVCASHWWRFDVDGAGSKLSMAGRRDPKSDIATFAVAERDGRILLADPAGGGGDATIPDR